MYCCHWPCVVTGGCPEKTEQQVGRKGGTTSIEFVFVFFFSSRRRHTRFDCDWSSDVCSSDLDGLGLGDNSKAALVTRSLAELVRLGVAMGGTAPAFYGLSGAGDLIVTCYSERSRNHTVGKRLGRGESLMQITQSMKMVAEGIPTARSAFECARQLKIETPIIDQVYSVLYERKKPTVALEEVLNREQKAERF